MIDELERLLRREGVTTQELIDYILRLEVDVPPEIQAGVLAKTASADEERRVRDRRSGPGAGVSEGAGMSGDAMSITPQRRLTRKTTLSSPASVQSPAGSPPEI